MTKTVKDVKRPNPTREPRKAPRYLWVSKGFNKDGSVPRRGGRTFDVRRNEWKRLKRGPRTAEALARIAAIERAWAAP